MSFINRRRGIVSSQNSESKNILTAKMFLGKEGNNAYIDPAALLNFIDNGRIEDIKEMEAFFNLVNEQLKMAINRRVQSDKAGLPYKYENFLRPKGPEGVKVIIIGRIKEFILDYQSGQFAIDFNLEDLVNEAEKA